MRIYVSILVICFLPFTLSAQNDWTLFPKEQVSYWSVGFGDIELFYNDSTTIESDFNIHYFGKNYYERSVGDCYEEVQDYAINHFIDFELPVVTSLRSDNHAWYWTVDGQDLPFYHLMEVGGSWFLPSLDNSNFDSIKITCEAIEWATFNDWTDSLKYFQLEAWQNGMPIPSDLDNEEFILSKAAGLLKFIPLDQLLTGNEGVWEIAGFKKEDEQVGMTNTFIDYFQNYAPGQIYKWAYFKPWLGSETIEEADKIYIDSLTSVFISNDSVILTLDRIGWEFISNSGNPNVDTVLFSETGLQRKFYRSRYQPAFDMAPQWFGLTNSTDMGQTKLMYLNRLRGNSDYMYISFYDQAEINEENCEIGNSFVEIGAFFLDTQRGLVTQIFESGDDGEILVGNTTLSDTMGNIDPILSYHFVHKKELKFNIFPNPSTTQIQIEIFDDLDITNSQVTIYDMRGRQIKSETINLSGATLDISALSRGVYMVLIQSDEFWGRKKFLKLK